MNDNEITFVRDRNGRMIREHDDLILEIGTIGIYGTAEYNKTTQTWELVKDPLNTVPLQEWRHLIIVQ